MKKNLILFLTWLKRKCLSLALITNLSPISKLCFNFLEHQTPIFMAKHQLPSQVMLLKLTKIYTLRMQ